MGKEIITVLGAVKPECLGLTSMHDYIFYDGREKCQRLLESIPEESPHKAWFPIKSDEPVRLENAGILYRNAMLCYDAFLQTEENALTEEIRLYRAAGGEALLDLWTAKPPLGGDAAAILRISQATGVHIVASAGYSADDSCAQELAGQDAQAYFKRLMHSMKNTSVKPGHMVSTLLHFNRDEENALRSICMAAKETGLSCSVCFSNNAIEHIDRAMAILREEGVPPERTILANIPLYVKPRLEEAIREPSKVAVDTKAAERCLDAGYNLSFCIRNAMGFELAGDYDCGDFLSFAALYSLIAKGYCNQLVLGNDCRGKIMLHRSGGEGYCRMLYYTLPMLCDTLGVSDYAISRMTKGNPARILAV